MEAKWAVLIGAFLLSPGACKSAAAPTEDPLARQCREAPDSDARCVHTLTGGNEEYESKAQIMAAEEQKEADAFNSRLARLRASAEEKARATRTASIAEHEPGGVRDESEPDPAELDPALQELTGTTGEQVDSGSSVRALTAAEPEPPPSVTPVVVIPTIPRRLPPPVLVDTLEPGGKPKTLGTPPTPEEYLRSARCLVDKDLPAVRAAVADGQKKKLSRQVLGGAALVILDAEGLSTAIGGEIQHRGLKQKRACSDSKLMSVEELLRALVGPSPIEAGAVDGYGKGLSRLRKELELRAGLPRPE